jgi:hypothetical protein
MKQANRIAFNKTDQPIKDHLTKVGGSPIWIQQAQWPKSQITNQPLTFLCQIELSNELFGTSQCHVAYIFLPDNPATGKSNNLHADVNSVIVQESSDKPCSKILDQKQAQQTYDDYNLEFTSNTEPEFMSKEDIEQIHEKEDWSKLQQYYENIDGNKIGGHAFFDDLYELSDPGYPTLLLQLDSTCTPFELKLGHLAMLYVFLSKDCKSGRLYWGEHQRQGCYGVYNQGLREVYAVDLLHYQNMIHLTQQYSGLNREDILEIIYRSKKHWNRPCDSSTEYLKYADRLEQESFIEIPPIEEERVCSSCGEKKEADLPQTTLCPSCTRLEFMAEQTDKWVVRVSVLFQDILPESPVFSGVEKSLYTNLLQAAVQQTNDACYISDVPVFKGNRTNFQNKLFQTSNNKQE